MPLTGVHLLLTLRCTDECDHCFVWGSPCGLATMTLSQVKEILRQSKRTKSVNMIYVEGGEPFLFYPVMLETLRMAKRMGFDIGVLSNYYWATDAEDSELWLKPIAKLGVSDLSLSADPLHLGDLDSESTKNVVKAATSLGIPTQILSVDMGKGRGKKKIGKAPIGYSGLMYKGRAAVNLAKDAPKKSWKNFDECPYENLEDPGRVHIDPYGFVHMCQGICMGNVFEKPLSRIMREYDHRSHPIVGPLVEGGPVALAKATGLELRGKYADECHLCYELRLKLREKYPDILCPDQMYGIFEL